VVGDAGAERAVDRRPLSSARRAPHLAWRAILYLVPWPAYKKADCIFKSKRERGALYLPNASR
jgi:hypothetical protein